MNRRRLLTCSLLAATATVAPVATTSMASVAMASTPAPTPAATTTTTTTAPSPTHAPAPSAGATDPNPRLSATAFRWVRPGARGATVRRIQRALRARGYRVVVNGKFGPLTTAAVRKFQRDKRLAATGHVGPKTWRALGLHRPGSGATTTTTNTTTTTTLPPGGYRHPKPNIERWHGVALEVGWAERDWKRLSCVINVESSGNPAARNPSSAMGLLQILYRAHKSWVGPDPSILLDGRTNLRLGLRLFKASGWRPWGNICG